MTDDLVARLREADEWMLVGLEGLAFHSDAPFDAADEIGRLRAELAKERERADAHYRALTNVTAKNGRLRAELAMINSLRSQATKECDRLTAERDALRELLRYASGYLLVADAPVDDLLARIDAALKEDK